MEALSKQDISKEAAAKKAAGMVKEGMIVGLGSGTTAAFFIAELGMRCYSGLKILAVATSSQAAQLAKEAGIPLMDGMKLTHVDLDIDGADEIDQKKQMIKGGGGALLREKIVAASAREMIVIVDEKKCVEQLGKFPLPVEIAPFAYLVTMEKLKEFGSKPILRQTRSQNNYITDNGNYIIDLHFSSPIQDPDWLNTRLHLIPGVIETGLFINLAKTVIIGHPNGTTTVLT